MMGSEDKRRGINLLALFLSLVAAAFVGFSVGLGAVSIISYASPLVFGDARSVQVASTVIGGVIAAMIFFGAWWIFYRLADRTLRPDEQE